MHGYRLSQNAEDRIAEALPVLAVQMPEGPFLWNCLREILLGPHAAHSLRTMHALGVLVFPHYLIVFSPLVHVFAAWVLAERPRILWLTCGVQLFVTVMFMGYIHVNGGAPRGDYGVTYRAQTAEQRALPKAP